MLQRNRKNSSFPFLYSFFYTISLTKPFKNNSHHNFSHHIHSYFLLILTSSPPLLLLPFFFVQYFFYTHTSGQQPLLSLNTHTHVKCTLQPDMKNTKHIQYTQNIRSEYIISFLSSLTHSIPLPAHLSLHQEYPSFLAPVRTRSVGR